MRIFLLSLTLGVTAVLFSSCASSDSANSSPDLRHMPPGPAVVY